MRIETDSICVPKLREDADDHSKHGHVPVRWCGQDEEHGSHGRCLGVRWLSLCGRPWSEHPVGRSGEPACSIELCEDES